MPQNIYFIVFLYIGIQSCRPPVEQNVLFAYVSLNQLIYTDNITPFSHQLIFNVKW